MVLDSAYGKVVGVMTTGNGLGWSHEAAAAHEAGWEVARDHQPQPNQPWKRKQLRTASARLSAPSTASPHMPSPLF